MRRERNESASSLPVIQNTMLHRSDSVMHQYRSRGRLDIALLGAINQRGPAISGNAGTSLLDSLSPATRPSPRRGRRFSLCGIPRQQDVCFTDGIADDSRMDLHNLRQFRHVAVHFQNTVR